MWISEHMCEIRTVGGIQLEANVRTCVIRKIMTHSSEGKFFDIVDKEMCFG